MTANYEKKQKELLELVTDGKKSCWMQSKPRWI